MMRRTFDAALRSTVSYGCEVLGILRWQSVARTGKDEGPTVGILRPDLQPEE